MRQFQEKSLHFLTFYATHNIFAISLYPLNTKRLFYIQNKATVNSPVYWIETKNSEKGDFIYGELQVGISADEATVIDNTGTLIATINGTDFIIHPTAFCLFFPKGKHFTVMAFEKIKHRKLSIANVFNTFLVREISKLIGVQFSSRIKDTDKIKLLASFNVKTMSFVKKSLGSTLFGLIPTNKEEDILKKNINGKLSASDAYKILMENNAYRTYKDDSIDYVSLDLTTSNGKNTNRTFKIDANGELHLNDYNTVTFNQESSDTREKQDYVRIYEALKDKLETTASCFDA